MKTLLLLILIAVFSSSCSSAKNPVEVGNVDWLRSYPTALVDAKKLDKPIFALFQEVPG